LNNLKQLGLAMRNYLESQETLPPNGIYQPASAKNTWSAMARLLPYIDQEPLQHAIDFNQPYSVQPNISSTRIRTFTCPSEVNYHGKTDSTGKVVHWIINYGVNAGRWMVLDPNTGVGGDGAFVPNRGCRVAEFTDGMSSTLALAEVKAYTDQLRNSNNPNHADAPLPATPADVLALGGTFKAMGGHTEWVDAKSFETGFTTLFPPNTQVPFISGGQTHDVDFISASEGNAANTVTYAAITARSCHPGLVHGVFLDGSARAFSNNVSQATWQALGTRSNNDVPGGDW
jgi:hypothetical protein